MRDYLGWPNEEESEQLAAQCEDEQQAYEVLARQAREWVVQWPNYCKACSGYGEFYYPGNRWQPPTSDPCEALPEDSCHRCGKPNAVVVDDACIYQPCKFCGWTPGQGIPSI
jgi:hypothetical protein